jgi:L-cysteine/cystine lyase
VVFGFDWQPGDEVITTTHEHPGLTEPLAAIAERRGVVVRMVEPRVEAITAALSARTRMVAISHVLWTTGEVLAVDRIAQQAHQAGAVVLVDGAQSGGAIPTDPAALDVDYYTFSGQKWLLGPSGTGALWVRDASLAGLSTAWPWYQSRQRRPGEPPRDWPDTRRLDAGTITTTALAGVSAAIDWREQVGLDAGFVRAAQLAATLRDALRAVASVDVVEVETPSTIVSFRVPGREPAAVVAAAEQQGVLVRFIPGFEIVRASVAFYNDLHDLDRLVAAVT